ncbi:MAG: hypothetical protein KA807_06690, partial [Prolixibacteraceae bacterium]|nr:hypothetical protein [Prolixibacteraceae bacterium]
GQDKARRYQILTKYYPNTIRNFSYGIWVVFGKYLVWLRFIFFITTKRKIILFFDIRLIFRTIKFSLSLLVNNNLTVIRKSLIY